MGCKEGKGRGRGGKWKGKDTVVKVEVGGGVKVERGWG